jgi:hypothetical protein
MLGAKRERSFVNPKPRFYMHITYFSSLSCKSEEKANGLSISPLSSELYRASKYSLALATVSLSVDSGALYSLVAL